MWISCLTAILRTFEVMIGQANDVQRYNERKAVAPSGIYQKFAYRVGSDALAALNLLLCMFAKPRKLMYFEENGR